MAQTKLRFRLYIVMFCMGVFFLTAAGLAVLRYGVLSYGVLASSFWFIFVYVAAWALVLSFAVDLFNGDGKLSGKRVLVLASGVMLTSAVFTHSVWTIATPRWSFSVSTDKATYKQGEGVIIIASLRNLGFISHSFRSASSNPVVVSIEYHLMSQVWCSSISRSVTGFILEPGETLERSFLWNQTHIYHPEKEISQGKYWIRAFIPRDSSEIFTGFDSLFSAWTTMNITSG